MENSSQPKSSLLTVKFGDIVKKNKFENEAWALNKIACGIDEVGRGCLAGPIVAAAAMLPIKTQHPLLRDSKLLSEEQRLEAYQWLIKCCFFGVGIINNRIIDRCNIHQATILAMKKAVAQIVIAANQQPYTFLVDAVHLSFADTNLVSIPVHAYPKGESWSQSIAAASIIAKVTRDAIMKNFEKALPGYALATHKGYGTTTHQECLDTKPYTLIHRTTFLHNTRKRKKEEHEKQQSIC